MLLSYTQPPVQHPTIASLQPPKKSIFSFMSSQKPASSVLPPIPESLPKGIYMYGDVGSGKTMMMDLFFDTLPASIKRKTRIHFHAFMQGVHKDLHKMKMQHGNEIDAIPFVAANIAERSSVLCFRRIPMHRCRRRNDLAQIDRGSHGARHRHCHHIKSPS